jgi:hypothetical protein
MNSRMAPRRGPAVAAATPLSLVVLAHALRCTRPETRLHQTRGTARSPSNPVRLIAQQIVAYDRPRVPLSNVTTLIAFNTRVTGLRVVSNGNVLVTNARFR